MNVSLLVTNYNKTHLFKKSLESILPQLTIGDEIIVVDDGNYDGVREVLASQPISWKYFFTNNKTYRSGCMAKNIALKMASNPIVVINDPEVYHITRCIDQIYVHLKENPRAFVVPGMMYFCNDANQNFEKAGVIKKSMAPFIGGVYREELMKVGGWDERFKFWGNDDNDLMHRLGMSGVQHISDMEMKAMHQWHPRPPQEAMGDANESILYEKDKKMVANEGIEWGEV